MRRGGFLLLLLACCAPAEPIEIAEEEVGACVEFLSEGSKYFPEATGWRTGGGFVDITDKYANPYVLATYSGAAVRQVYRGECK